MLANTAIEKYLKARLLERGENFGRVHNVEKLYRSLEESGLAPSVDEGFLCVLGKAYQLRYPDELQNGFSLSLAQVKILTETDSTVFNLRKGFGVEWGCDCRVIMQLDQMIEKNTAELFDRNVAFGSAQRGALFEEPTCCFEFRKLDNGDLWKMQVVMPIADDGVFA